MYIKKTFAFIQQEGSLTSPRQVHRSLGFVTRQAVYRLSWPRRPCFANLHVGPHNTSTVFAAHFPRPRMNKSVLVYKFNDDDQQDDATVNGITEEVGIIQCINLFLSIKS